MFFVDIQVCDIGDASKGSLSSYAYILMLLHYLQQCNPPVIPVLQTLYTDNKPPEKIVDGWNCWFQSDLKKIVGGRTLVIHCSKARSQEGGWGWVWVKKWYYSSVAQRRLFVWGRVEVLQLYDSAFSGLQPCCIGNSRI